MAEPAFVPDTTIVSADMNSDLSDIIDMLTDSLSRSGDGGMQAALKLDNDGFTYSTDPNTGMSRSAADEQVITCGGADVATFTSTAADVLALKIAGVTAFPVPTAQIADGAVTYAKIQDVSATSRLLGRSTAGAGDVEEITLGTGLAMVGGALTPTISPVLVPNYISGLTLSTAGSSTTMSIAAGVASDTTNAVLMRLAAAISKTTASWAVGTGNGGLDTGAIAASTWYHFYEIERVDTGVVDVIFSLNASTPALPTNYTIYRWIGAGKTNGSSQWIKFVQVGRQFIWDVSVVDQNAVVLGASTLYLLGSVPTGRSVTALIQVLYQSNGVGSQYNLWSPLVTGPGPIWANIQVANDTAITPLEVVTNTSGQIRAQSNSVGTISWTVTTYGWVDTQNQ